MAAILELRIAASALGLSALFANHPLSGVDGKEDPD